MRPFIASKGGPFLQIRSVDRTARQEGRRNLPTKVHVYANLHTVRRYILEDIFYKLLGILEFKWIRARQQGLHKTKITSCLQYKNVLLLFVPLTDIAVM